jgi:crotonobetainyl-CoA:carnitine CoA-transferase CaiB-like acyl-CoA transferase
VISVRTDEEWQTLCRILGRTELAADPKFADRPSRCKHAVELDKIVEEWTRSQTPEDVMRRLQAEEIPAGVAQAGDDLVADPQLRHRNYFARFDDSPVGPMEIPRSALRFAGMIDEPLSLPPRLGADTDAVLRDLLGYDEATIEQWKKEGVLS